MFLKGKLAGCLLVVCGLARAGQATQDPAQNAPSQAPADALPPASNPQTNPAVDPRDTRQRPLTPEEMREQEIRQFDPLDQDEPKAPGKGANADRANDRDAEQRRSRGADTALPGSIAATNKQNAAPVRGPQVIEEDEANAPPQQEYTGPAVLSRAYTVNRPMVAQDVKWRESLGLNANFNTGATTAAVTSSGAVAPGGNLYGSSFNWGLSGRRLFHHDQLGVAFSGDYQRYYPANGIYNGPNFNLALDYTHLISRRVSVTLTETASKFSQNYTLQNPAIDPNTSVANINLASSPNIQIFDTGTKQSSTQADFVWQKSARLSFNFGIGYFVIERNSPALIGNAGEQARGDVSYRWTRKATLGGYYSYSHYAYAHAFGVTDVNTTGLTYSYAFSRTLQLRLRGGVSGMESLSLVPVTLDPVIAALLGRPSVIIDAYRKSTTSDLSGQLVKDFKGNRTASLAYAHGISPGNGVYEASVQESVTASFATRVFRVYLIQLSGGRDSLSSVSQTVGKYQSENAQFGISRTLRGGIGLNFQISYRHFDITQTQITPNQVFVSSGVSWSPGTGKLWPF